MSECHALGQRPAGGIRRTVAAFCLLASISLALARLALAASIFARVDCGSRTLPLAPFAAAGAPCTGPSLSHRARFVAGAPTAPSSPFLFSDDIMRPDCRRLNGDQSCSKGRSSAAAGACPDMDGLGLQPKCSSKLGLLEGLANLTSAKLSGQMFPCHKRN